jgi:hypothetical protein
MLNNIKKRDFLFFKSKGYLALASGYLEEEKRKAASLTIKYLLGGPSRQQLLLLLLHFEHLHN